MSVRMQVTEQDPVIAYSMTRYGSIRIDIFSPENSKALPLMWHCFRMVIWNSGESGLKRETRYTEKAGFRDRKKAESWIKSVAAKYGDEVRWNPENPEKPGDLYGYSGNWTIDQANGSEG